MYYQNYIEIVTFRVYVSWQQLFHIIQSCFYFAKPGFPRLPYPEYNFGNKQWLTDKLNSQKHLKISFEFM